MKKIFKYFGVILSIVLMGAFTACDILNPVIEPADLGLGIKVFFPTKVVAGQPMTINGSGFKDVTEIEFPGGVKVTNFEKVGNDMIRVTAPAGIAAAGGKIIVRTADEQVESPLPLTLGHTAVSGFSKQAGEEISGGEQITIYGTDLEFINGVELLDADGNPVVLSDAAFYRKGTSSVVITIPKKVFEGTFTGKLFTFDGQEILLPELKYKPASEGGHWETQKTVIWENKDPEGNGKVSWNGTYRFALEGTDEKAEAIAEIPQDVWEKMKTTPFFMRFTPNGDWFQVRIATGWWNNQWPDGKDNDISPGYRPEMLIDNGDGSYSIEVNLKDSDLAANMDKEHLLFTGDGYTVQEIFFAEDVWVDGGEGHLEIVKTPIWENKDPEGNGKVSWNGTYRFALEGTDEKAEAIAEIPQDVWEKMKTTPFFMRFTPNGDWFQVRIATGWWNNQWPDGKDNDISPGYRPEMLIDNGDGSYSIEVNLKDSDLAANMDKEHLLFTGDGYTVQEIYFAEEVWVGGGGEPKEVAIWENKDPEGNGKVSWNGTYRFALEGTDEKAEALVELPQDVWEKMKTTPFYIKFTPNGDWFQVRIATGWWNNQWPDGKDNDISPGYRSEMLIDNGDGSYSIEVNLKDSDLAANMDKEHLLFTGDGYTPLKLYFLE